VVACMSRPTRVLAFAWLAGFKVEDAPAVTDRPVVKRGRRWRSLGASMRRRAGRTGGQSQPPGASRPSGRDVAAE
jgi:hypothetical protein